MYSQKVSERLKGFGISVGDRMKMGEREGILMPKPETGDPNCVVLKLDNGYNIGLNYEDGAVFQKLEGKEELEKFPKKEVKFDEKKPVVAILSTGGTIASRVDYRTGGVVPAFSAEDLARAVPELAEIAFIRGKSILNLLSENIRPEHYKFIAGAAASEIAEGAAGVVILHGTDTMHYTSAMLSFMLRDLSVPVILVGAQRSSDRGSSDAAMNLLCAVNFAANADFSGVALCMHASLDDKFCHIHPGTRVRKMHTSRRDAFRTIDADPIAKVHYEGGKIEILGEHPKRGNLGASAATALEPKVGLLKAYPGMGHEQVAFFRENGFKGLVIEGTGLGHMPAKGDEASKENDLVFEEIGKLTETGCIVVMASQCIYGDVNMNVYSAGRDLVKKGIIPGKGMLPEAAYMKLMWLLGNFGPEKAREMISQNIAGEIVERRNVTADFEKAD